MRAYAVSLAIVGFALALLLGCEKKNPFEAKKGPPAESPSGIEQALGLDAGSLTVRVDPPAPAGDLKSELERFVNVDTCVAERAKLDPLVGDALGAIGYDTFLHDACRLLEAAKTKKREACDKIDASPLRARCQSLVAIAARTPESCPLLFDGIVARGRQPTCLAVAGRDPRLCAAESRAVIRTTCEALTARDDARCDALSAVERPSCKREVARFRSVLEPPLEGLPKLPAVHAKLVVKGEGTTPDLAKPESDLAADFARGAVVTLSPVRQRVELGTSGESELARIATAPTRGARAGVALIFTASSGGKSVAIPVLDRLELELPGQAPLITPSAKCDCKIEQARLDKTRGGEVSFVLSGTVRDGTRTYKIALDVATFVRDVVEDLPNARTIPPLHPPVPVKPR